LSAASTPARARWQTLEYYEAHDKHVKSPGFPVVLMLLAGNAAPGLPFLRQLHWIVTADPTSEKDVARHIDVTAGTRAQVGELWRYTSPYRGLSAASAPALIEVTADARRRPPQAGARPPGEDRQPVPDPGERPAGRHRGFPHPKTRASP
jgi:hypothetical protein